MGNAIFVLAATTLYFLILWESSRRENKELKDSIKDTIELVEAGMLDYGEIVIALRNQL